MIYRYHQNQTFFQMDKMGNWQIATDTLNTIIKAKRHNIKTHLKSSITKNICDILKLKKKVNAFSFLIVY